MHQIRFRLGARDPAGKPTTLPQTPELDFSGLTSKGRQGKRREERRGKEGRNKERVRKGSTI